MKYNNNKHPLVLIEKANTSKPSDRKRMSEFMNKVKMKAQKSQLNGKNS
ncbi:hypothetical protein ACFWDG_05510 [Peribacillus sp. NPDC060186]